MNKKIIALAVALVIIVAGAAYVLATQNSNVPNLTVNNSTNDTCNVAQSTSKVTLHNDTRHSSSNHTKTNDTSGVKISAAQAQKIAVKAIKDDFGETYTAGTPSLYTIKGTPWWHVPLNNANGGYVGSLDVNAITGETSGQW